MARLKNWPFKSLVKFLRAYGFEYGHTEGSHYFYNGRIKGEDRVVQAIYSKKEKNSQSDKTMKLAVRHSGIPKKYFEEWKSAKKIYQEIIY